MRDTDQGLVDEQIRYYRHRAPEYYEWFYRQGRYDYGPDHRRQWHHELAEAREAIRVGRVEVDLREGRAGRRGG